MAARAPSKLFKHNGPHYNINNSMYLATINYEFIICNIAHVMILYFFT